MAELSDVVVDGKPTRTIAIESEDAAAVIAAIRSLGLGGYLNTSYPRGLAALDRAIAAISGMVAEAQKHSALAIVAVGTAGLRIADNRDDDVAAIEARTGVRIEVISGEEEARLAYLAARSGLGLAEGSLVVFDTGGGSSQFTFGNGNDVAERFSVDVGAVRYTERFRLDAAVTSAVLHDDFAALSADLSRLDGRPVPGALVAMGGATTNIAAVKRGRPWSLSGPRFGRRPARGVRAHAVGAGNCMTTRPRPVLFTPELSLNNLMDNSELSCGL